MFRHHLIVRKCTHSVYCLCGASEVYQQVIEIQLSELGWRWGTGLQSL